MNILPVQSSNKRVRYNEDYSDRLKAQGPFSNLPDHIFLNCVFYLDAKNQLAANQLNKRYNNLMRHDLPKTFMKPYYAFLKLYNHLQPEILNKCKSFVETMTSISLDSHIEKLNDLEKIVNQLPISYLLIENNLINKNVIKFEETFGISLTEIDENIVEERLKREGVFNQSVIGKIFKIKELVLELKNYDNLDKINFDENQEFIEEITKKLSNLDCWQLQAYTLKKACRNNPDDEFDYMMDVLEDFFRGSLVKNSTKNALDFFKNIQDQDFLTTINKSKEKEQLTIATLLNSIVISYKSLLSNNEEYSSLQKDTNYEELKYINTCIIQFFNRLTDQEKWRWNRVFFGATWSRILHIYAGMGDKTTFHLLHPNLKISYRDENGNFDNDRECWRQKIETWMSLLEYDLANNTTDNFYQDLIAMDQAGAVYNKEYSEENYAIPNKQRLSPIFRLEDKTYDYYQNYLVPFLLKIIDAKEYDKAIDITQATIEILDHINKTKDPSFDKKFKKDLENLQNLDYSGLSTELQENLKQINNKLIKNSF